jgi:hypothetical protein
VTSFLVTFLQEFIVTALNRKGATRAKGAQRELWKSGLLMLRRPGGFRMEGKPADARTAISENHIAIG